MRQAARLGIFWLALIAAIGCRGGKTETQPSPIAIRFESYAGSILSGPTISSTPIDQKNLWRVKLNLIALENDPGAVLMSAGSASRLIRLERAGEAYQAVSQLAQRLRVGSGDAARELLEKIEAGQFGTTTPLEVREFVLTDGTTTRLNITDTQNDPAKNIEVAMHRASAASGSQLLMQIRMRDLVRQKSDDDEESEPIEEIRLESVLLDPFSVNVNETIVVVDPRDIPRLEARAIVLRLDIDPADDSDAQHEALARLTDEVRTSDEQIKARMVGGSWPGFERALAGANDPDTRRSSLQFIASRTGGVIALDLILLADDDQLATYTNQVNQAISASTLDRKPELLGWLMDRVALEWLVKGQSSNEKFPGELQSILLRHAGEAGKDSGTMSSLLSNVQSRQEFSARVIAENLIALEDTSPASRVRAFDWLASIGKAPPNYDPLGADDARRAALESIEQ